MKVIMRKLLGGERIRTDSVEGVCEHLPEIGVPFIMIGKSLDFVGGLRLISTSPVVEISYELDGTITTTTENSTYQLTISEET